MNPFNNKPINVEAQRVQKVIQDTTRKLEVLALLNEDFFAEIRKSDEDVINQFGPQVGKLLIKHGQLEEEFTNNCLGDGGVKMIALDDEETTEEQRKTILDLQFTTSKIVRIFTSDAEMFQKLQAYKVNSPDFSAFMDTVGKLNELMEFKLYTPKEEVDTIRKNQKVLEDKVLKLKENYDSKKDAYDKYCEECSKSKELRDANIKALREQISNVQALNEQQQREAMEQGFIKEKELEEKHNQTMAKLTKDKNTLSKKMEEEEKKNAQQEKEDRKAFVKVFQDYHNNMDQYDKEQFGTVAENKKIEGDYEDTANDLREIEAELNQRLEERRKRDEITAIMTKKKEEQNEKMEKLGRACEWLQAHWRGMMARKEAAKAIGKGKKKKKKKK